MRFYTVLRGQKEEVLFSPDGGQNAYAIRELGLPYEDMDRLIEGLTEEERRSLPERAKGAVPVEWESVRLLAPIVRPRQDLICLGINYRDHASEAGSFSKEAFGGERPYTIYFSKRVSRANGSGEPVPSYEGYCDSLDYEAELACVLGRSVKGISEAEAESAVFGYTIVNDITARNIQTRHKQWYLGKSLDGFTPMGPCIVTPDELGDPKDLAISSRVNGEIRQQSNTKYMIQTVAGAIAELSQAMTLEAGTIIAMGTPAGVGMGMQPPCFLKKGDEVVCEIEKIGTLRSPVE